MFRPATVHNILKNYWIAERTNDNAEVHYHVHVHYWKQAETKEQKPKDNLARFLEPMLVNKGCNQYNSTYDKGKGLHDQHQESQRNYVSMCV